MDKQKVLYELRERAADPFESIYCMKLEEAIEDNTILGKLLIQLLEGAENGQFRETK